MNTVTSKNSGRVAAGKKLVEWNRKNKADLLKNKAQVGSSDAPSASSDQQEPQSQTSTVLYSGGALAVLVGVVALYLYRGKFTPDSTPSKAPPAPPSEPDIFHMN